MLQVFGPGEVDLGNKGSQGSFELDNDLPGWTRQL